MKKESDLSVKLATWLINTVWKKHLGIKFNRKHHIICRFYPTCSDYAIIALDKYGLINGLYMTAKRIRRCSIKNTDSCYDYP
jgi:putative component of membrane protein insertase Oxa1/YidC/SpoIIIJ protein YidD